MTTIVYDKEKQILYHDGRIMLGDDICSDTATKLWKIDNHGQFGDMFKLTDRIIFTGAGCYPSLITAAHFLSSKTNDSLLSISEKYPKILEAEFAFDGFIIGSNGVILAFDYPTYAPYLFENEDRFITVGTGAKIARSLLAANVPPDDLISYVAVSDSYTGSKTFIHNL